MNLTKMCEDKISMLSYHGCRFLASEMSVVFSHAVNGPSWCGTAIQTFSLVKNSFDKEFLW